LGGYQLKINQNYAKPSKAAIQVERACNVCKSLQANFYEFRPKLPSVQQRASGSPTM